MSPLRFVTNAADLVLGLFLILGSVACMQGGSADFQIKADAYLTEKSHDEEFSGAVLVATNGNVLFARGYGLANWEHSVPNTTNTIFRLGSVTKQFTAMCILMLQEDGRLNVTNRISGYVEDCPEAWNTVTVQHLLTHTSGIPSFTSFPDNLHFERLPTTVEATVRRFRDRALQFEPGSRMRYSNSGYVLLGYIIEKVSGRSYEEFVTEKIFVPLGMRHSGYDRPARILPDRASGYSRRGGSIVNCVPFAMDTPHAAGALYSTTGDLLIWDEALYADRLISTETRETMFTPFLSDYCYGWFKLTFAGHSGYGHGGGISGFVTHVTRFPAERVYMVVLSNFDWAKPGELTGELARLYFDAE